MSAQYVYLIQEREFIKTSENIYKIGKSKQENNKRINQYPKQSKLILQILCNNCDELEKKLINIFKYKYNHRKDIGNEYFEGDSEDMIKNIYFIRNNIDDIINFEKIEKEKIKDEIQKELLKIHNQKKSCKKNINLENSLDTPNILNKDLNIPIETSNIIVKNIGSNNIGNNITKSFDEDWDLSHIDIHKKIKLFLNNSKFTSTLENILENEVNLNVLIDNTSDNCIVFTNNKLINMNIKDIIKKTMDKLHKHLNNFHNDIINPNILNLRRDIFNNGLKTINIEYDNFNKNTDIQIEFQKYITDIYNKKKQTTFNFIEKNGY